MKMKCAVISTTTTGGVVVYLDDGIRFFFETFQLAPKFIIHRKNGYSFLNEEPQTDFPGDIQGYSL